jgi:hypothetical protein
MWIRKRRENRLNSGLWGYFLNEFKPMRKLICQSTRAELANLRSAIT